MTIKWADELQGNSVTMLSLRVFAFATALLVCNESLGQAAGDLVFHVETDKAQYHLGEPVEITGRTCNEGDTPVVLGVCDHCVQRSGLEIRDLSKVVAFQQSPPFEGCAHSCDILEWLPGECLEDYSHTWQQQSGGFPWPGDGKQVGPGVYRVVHRDASVQFEILGAVTAVPAMSRISMLVLVSVLLLGSLLMLRRGRVSED